MKQISKLIIITVLITFLSCNKDEEIRNSSSQAKTNQLSKDFTSRTENNTIKPEEYGFYHNEGIKLYNEKYLQGDITKLKDKDTKTVITELLTLMKQKFPGKFENVNTSEFLIYFETSSPTSKFDFLKTGLKIKKHM